MAEVEFLREERRRPGKEKQSVLRENVSYGFEIFLAREVHRPCRLLTQSNEIQHQTLPDIFHPIDQIQDVHHENDGIECEDT